MYGSHARRPSGSAPAAEICEFLATNNHVKQITIPTGAITSDLIARQVETTLQRCPDTQIVVNLSIDHIGEKHDWLRGVPTAKFSPHPQQPRRCLVNARR